MNYRRRKLSEPGDTSGGVSGILVIV